MSLGSDQKHDYPERGWQSSNAVSPAGKEQTRRIDNPLRRKQALKAFLESAPYKDVISAVPKLCLPFRG